MEERRAAGTSGDSRQMTKLFKALADDTRQRILYLLESGECSVGEIVGNFHLSQPTISRHLSVLKEAELVVDQRRGQRVVYRLNRGSLAGRMRDFCRHFQECRDLLREEHAEAPKRL